MGTTDDSLEDGASACRPLLLALPNLQQGQLGPIGTLVVCPSLQQGLSGLQSGSSGEHSLLCQLALLPCSLPYCTKLCMWLRIHLFQLTRGAVFASETTA